MAKVLGNLSQGRIFVVSAPAGTGKTTLVQMLTEEFPCVVESISYTTRPIRYGEVAGIHYHFIDENQFEQKIQNQEMLEYARIYGYYYGTAWQSVQKLQEEGKHVVLVIDVQGALQLREKLQKAAAVFIFIQPPSFEILRERLVKRASDSKESIETRLSIAQKECESSIYYDYAIVNDDLRVAYQVLRSIVIAEEHKILWS